MTSGEVEGRLVARWKGGERIDYGLGRGRGACKICGIWYNYSSFWLVKLEMHIIRKVGDYVCQEIMSWTG